MALQKKAKIPPELMEEIARLIDERVKAVYVTREDFNELKEVVKQLGENMVVLAQAQRRTEESLESFKRAMEESLRQVWDAINGLTEGLNQLTIRVNNLAEAQKRTEERLNELAEAQRRTEERLEAFERETAENFNRVWSAIENLTIRVNELAEAQKRTEERLNQLAQRVDQLAEAQRKTEERLNELIIEHQRTREILMGISDTVGYGLEDKIMPYMYDFARSEFGVEVEIVERRNIVYPDGRYDEVNVYIEGKKDGRKVYVIGECKSRPSKKEVKELMSVRERLSKFLNADVYAFIVGYTFSPEVEDFIRETYPDLKMVKSYEFDLKYGKRS